MLPYLYWINFSKSTKNSNLVILNENRPIYLFIFLFKCHLFSFVDVNINYLKKNKKNSNYFIDVNNVYSSFLFLYWWVYFLMTIIFFYLY